MKFAQGLSDRLRSNGMSPKTTANALLQAGLASALWKSWRRGFIEPDHASDALISTEKTIAFWHDADVLLPGAIEWPFRSSIMFVIVSISSRPGNFSAR